MHVISRETFGRELFNLYIALDIDAGVDKIEKILNRYGFEITVDADPFGRMYLYDTIEKREISGTSVS